MALKNFTQFTPYTVLSATDFLVGYRSSDEIRTDLDSMSLGVSALLISKGFLPGTIVGRVQRVSYRYTIIPGSPVNAVSGVDDNGLTLSYTPSQVEVYRNGSHLVNSLDFLATNSTQITNLSTLNLGDIVEVVALSGVGATIQYQLSGFIGSLVQRNYRYSVAAGNTITPGSTLIQGPDDYNYVMEFNSNSFQVYLNGSHLVRDYDYTSYTSGTSFTLLMPVANGDSVDVVSLSAVFTSSLSAISAFSGISRINSGDRIALSTSTGSITVSSQTNISDYPASDWTNANHIARWGTLQAYLSGVAQSNSRTRATDVYPQYFGNVTSTGGFYGTIVAAPNGKLYLMPQDTSLAYLLDPNNDSISVISSSFVTSQQSGGILHPNGRIYSFPYNGSLIRYLDPSNNSVVVAGTVTGKSTSIYARATLTPNGKFLMYPWNPNGGTPIASVVYLFDPSNSVVQGIHTISGAVREMYVDYTSFVAPNGKVYVLPFNSTNQSIVLKIDPDTNSVQRVATITIPGQTLRPVITPQGNCILSGTLAFTLDPSNDTIRTIATVVHIMGNPILHPNGKIYSVPNGTIQSYFDPETNTQGTLPYVTGNQGNSGFLDGVVAPNGNIYFSPGLANSGLAKYVFLNNNNWDINVVTNPMFNKGSG